MKALFGEDYEKLPSQEKINRLKGHLNSHTSDAQQMILTTKHDDQYLADWMYDQFATQPHLLDQFWDLVESKSLMTDKPGSVWLTAIRYGHDINLPFNNRSPLHAWLQRCEQADDNQKSAYVHLTTQTISHPEYDFISKDGDGNTALHQAIANGQTDLALNVINAPGLTDEKRKTLLDSENDLKQSLLSLAVSKEDVATIVNLLDKGASYDLNVKYSDHFLIDVVCESGSEKDIKGFWQKVGINIGYTTAKMPIVWRSNVEHGGDPNQEFLRMPPLHKALQMLKIFKEYKHINFQEGKAGYTQFTQLAEYIINLKKI